VTNLLGWIVAGAFLLATVALVVSVVTGTQEHDPPTSATADPALLEMHRVPHDWALLGIDGPERQGNALQDYWQGARQFESLASQFASRLGPARATDPDLLESIDRSHLRILGPGNALEIARRLTPEALEMLLKVHEHVRRGIDKADATLVGAIPMADLIRKDLRDCPAAELLGDLCAAEQVLVLHHLLIGDLDKASRFAREQLLLGFDLNRTRGRAEITLLGLRSELFALGQLRTIANKQGLDEQAGRIDRFAGELSAKVYRPSLAKYAFFRRNWPEAGDVIHIADRDEDRMWQVEALLRMGPLKFRQESVKRNRSRIDSILDEYSAHADPLLSTAAQTARDFTRQDARDFGVSFME
jgi:hypothetical protein